MKGKILSWLGAAGLAILLPRGLKWALRRAADITFDHFLYRLMSDAYTENLWELVSAISRIGLYNQQENALRAHASKVIQRPLGSPKRFPGFSGLMFNAAQLHTLPTPLGTRIDTRVIIGREAARPLEIELPIIISGMAYGEALTEAYKIALARGASLAGTAVNTGEGPFLPAERAAAKKLILQYNRSPWNKEEEILRQGDAIEIQFGQGALAGVGHIMKARDIDGKLRRQLGLKPGQDAVTESRQAGIETAADLRALVEYLREVTGGVPIGIKLAPGKYLEKDLDFALQGRVDFIAIDGAQAATKGGAPILADDFCLPTIFALCRAVRFLEQKRAKRRVSLLISGGLYTPGDFLKAIALGADAVCIGTAALFSVAHTQAIYALPWEPPTQLAWYDGVFREKFDPRRGAESLARFLKSCREEMEEAIRALGKTSLAQVNREDLFALDPETARITGVPLGYHPQRW
ncbi:MAG TPA: FMN-binding glutamate synthase family protein [Firmicutes bacterium]|nr:FMN-binding glutamate synthase family protein [Bacillota bacterium]